MSDVITIVAAAIKSTHNGQAYSVPRPGRHHNVIRHMADSGVPTPIRGEQGFILSNGEFASRAEAYEVAKNANQLLERAGSEPPLYTEDVW